MLASTLLGPNILEADNKLNHICSSTRYHNAGGSVGSNNFFKHICERVLKPDVFVCCNTVLLNVLFHECRGLEGVCVFMCYTII